MQIEGFSVTLQSKLAEGGFRTLFFATDSSNCQYVGKVLQAPDPDDRARIQQEIRIQQSLSSCPHVVRVLGSHSLGHQIFILLELCPQNLVAEMNQALGRGLPALRIAHIFASVLRAVRAMHCRDPPIIHRNLKPENVVTRRNTSGRK
jgi:AP2-associated kinase